MRIIKHRLHEGLNTIEHFGTLKLKHLEYQDNKLHGWFIEQGDSDNKDNYQVYIAITGEGLHDEYHYVCSVQCERSGGYYVVHAFD